MFDEPNPYPFQVLKRALGLPREWQMPRGLFDVFRGVNLHLLDLGGDIAGNGISKLFLTIAAAFAEAERDRIRERIGQVKADQKARGLYLGGDVRFGFRRGDDGELSPMWPPCVPKGGR